MSFRCEVCGNPQPPRTKATKVVLETRQVAYPPVREIMRDGREGRFIKNPMGSEVVKEVTVCPTCAAGKFDVKVVERKIL